LSAGKDQEAAEVVLIQLTDRVKKIAVEGQITPLPTVQTRE
jgi:hypothetical protein